MNDMKVEKHPDSFSSSLRVLLVLGQACGLLPLKGIRGGNATFGWMNPVHLYALFISTVTVFFDACYTLDNLNAKFGIDVYASTVFYTGCLLTTLLFLQIAREFAEISADFDDVEVHMTNYGFPLRLAFKIKLFLSVGVILAAVEHGTLVWINVASAWRHSSEIGKPFIPLLYAIRFSPIERRVPYSLSGFLTFLWVNIVCTFNWNYTDFFLVCLSMEISTRFALINSDLKKTPFQAMNSTYFARTNAHYNRLSLLTKKTNKKIGKIILVSFFSNLYHLSLQLARTLKLEGNLFERVYFYFSLSYLIARLILVLLFASEIHVESKKPAKILFSIPALSPEGIRFLHQVLTDEIALTGNNFFTINRNFAMSVIGTILTYQAFLLQFNSLNQKVEIQVVRP